MCDVYADYITQDIVDGCNVSSLRPTQNNITKFIPKFRVKTFTCNSGYFLPANTDHCVQCPNGYTCPGGTFDFNPDKARGITKQQTITNNLPNVCSKNFTPGNFRPVFRPHTINLNWYLDENATTPMTVPTASQKCTYGEKITLPPEPTRPGYIFSGWKLKKNN